MAVEYNQWTGNRDNYNQLSKELTEVLSDTPVKYIRFSEEGPTGILLYIGFDNQNCIKLGLNTNSVIYRQNRQETRPGNLGSLRYFAKENGELLISSVGSGTGCFQMGIGPCSDGQWGMAMAYLTDDANASDDIETLSSNGGGQKHGLAVDTVPGKMFLVLRNAVRFEDITFDNLFFNCYGQADSWSVIQFNGERYAVGNRATGHNVNMLMKL